MYIILLNIPIGRSCINTIKNDSINSCYIAPCIHSSTLEPMHFARKLIQYAPVIPGDSRYRIVAYIEVVVVAVNKFHQFVFKDVIIFLDSEN